MFFLSTHFGRFNKSNKKNPIRKLITEIKKIYRLEIKNLLIKK